MSSEATYTTESHWVNSENEKFSNIMHKFDTLSTGSSMVYLEVLFAFMSQYYNGQEEWPAYKMQDLSDVELRDTSIIESSFEGYSSDNPTTSVSDAYDAANNALFDLDTNPIFDGSSVPQTFLSNTEQIFGVTASQKTVTVTINGNPKPKTVNYFDKGTNGANVNWTRYFWQGEGLSPGNPGGNGSISYQAWMLKMQNVQSRLQENTTLFTDMSSTDQSEYKTIASGEKELLSSWENLNKSTVSLQQTEIKAEVRG